MDKVELYHQYEGMVYGYIKKNMRVRFLPDHDYEDLIQEMRMGLWKAILNHDPSRGQLGTIAMHCISNAYKMYFRPRKALKRQAEVLSYNVMIATDSRFPFESYQAIESNYNLEDDVLVRNALDGLDAEDWEWIRLFNSYDKQNQLAKALKKTPKYISSVKYGLINKITG